MPCWNRQGEDEQTTDYVERLVRMSEGGPLYGPDSCTENNTGGSIDGWQFHDCRNHGESWSENANRASRRLVEQYMLGEALALAVREARWEREDQEALGPEMAWETPFLLARLEHGVAAIFQLGPFLAAHYAPRSTHPALPEAGVHTVESDRMWEAIQNAETGENIWLTEDEYAEYRAEVERREHEAAKAEETARRNYLGVPDYGIVDPRDFKKEKHAG